MVETKIHETLLVLIMFTSNDFYSILVYFISLKKCLSQPIKLT